MNYLQNIPSDLREKFFPAEKHGVNPNFLALYLTEQGNNWNQTKLSRASSPVGALVVLCNLCRERGVVSRRRRRDGNGWHYEPL